MTQVRTDDRGAIRQELTPEPIGTAPPHAANRAGDSEGDRFDIPFVLGLAFWATLVGVLLERSQILLRMFKTGSPFASPVGYFAFSLGSLLLNFAALLGVVLVPYYLVLAIRKAGPTRRLFVIMAAAPASLSVLSAMTGLVFEATVVIFLSSQFMALLAVIIFMATALRRTSGPLRCTLIVLPAVCFLLLQINQFYFFFPHIMPSTPILDMSRLLLLMGQVVFLVFTGLASFFAARLNRRFGMPIFVPMLIAVSVLFIAATSIIVSEKARIMFFRIIEVQYFLPLSAYIYPLVFSLIAFAFSLFLAPSSKDRAFQITRLRSGYAIGFIALGTFTPATCHESLFILLGMVLWIKAVGMETPADR
jgi:hypothetical protein